MAKTSVNTIISRIKRRGDYDIDDDDLKTLILDSINDSLKVIYQLLVDRGLYIDVGQSTVLATVASQAYIDISSTLADAGDIIKLSERTNDKPITKISYSEFIDRYPDPTANSSSTPDHWALWTNRIYLGPTPSAIISVYAEHLGIPSDVAAGSDLPYKSKYDPLVIAMAKLEIIEWLDKKDAVGIAAAKAKVKDLKDSLITKAAVNIGQSNQTESRIGTPDFHPRVP